MTFIIYYIDALTYSPAKPKCLCPLCCISPWHGIVERENTSQSPPSLECCLNFSSPESSFIPNGHGVGLSSQNWLSFFHFYKLFCRKTSRWLLAVLLPLAKFHCVCFKQPDELETHDLEGSDAHNFKAKFNMLLAMWFRVICIISLLQS